MEVVLDENIFLYYVKENIPKLRSIDARNLA